MTASQERVRVWLVVYDLLPAGRLSSIAFLLGVGIYHTSVRIEPFPYEYAYGGHPHPHVSGVFSTPFREDRAPPLPGLRWVKEVDMGEVRLPTSSSSSSSSSGVKRVRSGSSSKASLGEYPPRLEDDDDEGSSAEEEADRSWSGLARLPSKDSPNPSIRQVHRVLDRLQRSSRWRGTSYDLLNNNCNSFTDTLCRRLTGQGIPGWCNRAASVGTMLPCLIPAEWIEPPEAQAPVPQTLATYDQVRPMV